MRAGHNGAIATTVTEAPVNTSQVKSYIRSCYTAVIMLQSECVSLMWKCMCFFPLLLPKVYYIIKCLLFMNKSKQVYLSIMHLDTDQFKRNQTG